MRKLRPSSNAISSTRDDWWTVSATGCGTDVLSLMTGYELHSTQTDVHLTLGRTAAFTQQNVQRVVLGQENGGVVAGAGATAHAEGCHVQQGCQVGRLVERGAVGQRAGEGVVRVAQRGGAPRRARAAGTEAATGQ